MDLLHLTMSLSLVMEPLLSGQFLALPESLAFSSQPSITNVLQPVMAVD